MTLLGRLRNIMPSPHLFGICAGTCLPVNLRFVLKNREGHENDLAP